MTYQENYLSWVRSPYLDEESRKNLKAIENDEQEKKLRFAGSLSFGTAGLRGVMKEGTDAMNLYTVSKATQGFADYILRCGGAKKGVVIAFDCRNNSRRFAFRAAEVVAGNGIRVYLYRDLRPTPLLSFSILHLGCIAGINITASHNPAEYNGYKAYWEDGAQLAPERADAVSDCIGKVDIFTGVKSISLEEAESKGLLTYVGEKEDEAYLKAVRAELVDPTLIPRAAETLKVVYTPLYGAGAVLVPRNLRACGLRHLYVVEEETGPDGDFPGMKNPNPEYPEVFARGVELAKKTDADLIIATDPDSDRTGVTVRKNDGTFVTLNGNQIGVLLLHYIIASLKENDALPPDAYAVTTLVSSPLVGEICKKNGVTLHLVLTGFKFIGEVIKRHLETGKGTFLFGFEESYGYLKGTYARDKDAVVASMLITEAAAFYELRGKTLYDALLDIYAEYGVYTEKTVSVMSPGADGAEKIAAFMNKLRASAPEKIGGEKVVTLIDCLKGTETDLVSKKIKKVDFPESNVLCYRTEKGNTLVVRPSGTEPKYKIYYMLNGKDQKELDKKLESFQKTVAGW